MVSVGVKIQTLKAPKKQQRLVSFGIQQEPEVQVIEPRDLKNDEIVFLDESPPRRTVIIDENTVQMKLKNIKMRPSQKLSQNEVTKQSRIFRKKTIERKSRMIMAMTIGQAKDFFEGKFYSSDGSS